MRYRMAAFFLLFLAVTLSGLLSSDREHPARPETAGATSRGSHWQANRLGVEFSSRDSVRLAASVPGVNVEDRLVDGTSYQRIRIPGTETYSEIGMPDVPVFRSIIAIPECQSVDVLADIVDSIELQDVYVEPHPEERRSPFGDIERIYERDLETYSADRYFPENIVRIRSIGYLRGQRLAILEYCPVRFNPVRRKLTVLQKVHISLKSRQPTGDVIKNAGPMSDVMAATVLNYVTSGGVASPRGGNGPNLSGGGGQVRWCQGNGWQTVASDASSFGADYVIIVGDTLATDSAKAWVDTLAYWRADYNGFNVGIAKVSQLHSPPDTANTPVAMRNFIKAVYDSATAAHMGDGRLGYVLLLGDAFSPSRDVVLPSYYGWADTVISTYMSTDAYYSLLDDSLSSDYFPDVYLGRLPVDADSTNWELKNVVQNIKGYEPLPTEGAWMDRVLMISGDERDFYDEGQGAAGFAAYFDYIQNEYVPADKTVSQMHAMAGDTTDAVFSTFAVDSMRNVGYWAVGLYDHGNYFYLAGRSGACFLPADYDKLSTSYRPLVFAMGCHLGEFDYTPDKIGLPNSSDGYGACCPDLDPCVLERGDTLLDHCDAMCERLVLQRNGAIGAIGYPRAGLIADGENEFVCFFRALFEEHSGSLGNVHLVMKLLRPGDRETLRLVTLFGDPAVNMLWRDVSHESIDLCVSRSGILSLNGTEYLSTNDDNEIGVTVKNIGSSDASQVKVTIWSGEPGQPSSTRLDTTVASLVRAFSDTTVTLTVDGSDLSIGTYTLYVELDPDEVFSEPTRENNVAFNYFDTLPYVTGFPLKLSDYAHHSVRIADIHSRSGVEILFATYDSVHCYASNGTGHIWSFSRGHARKTEPLIANIYKDGVSKVVYEAGDHAYILNATTGAPEDSIEIDDLVYTYVDQSYGIGDLESNDDELELVTFKCVVDSLWVVACRVDGSEVWREFIGGDLPGSGGSQGLAIGDINADGDAEVLVAVEDSLRVLAADGDRLWEGSIGHWWCGRAGARSVVLFDRDGDAQMEILANGNDGYPALNAIFLFDSDGNELESCVIGGGTAQWVYMGAADLECDGDVDVVVVRNNALWILSDELVPVDTLSIPEEPFVSPILLCDINGDNDIEIVTVSEKVDSVIHYTEDIPTHRWTIRVFDYQLNAVGTPIVVRGSRVTDDATRVFSQNCAQPAIADVNSDGKPEIVFVSSDSVLHVAEIGSQLGAAPWPTPCGNAMNTNTLEQPIMGNYSEHVSLFNRVRVLGDAYFDSTVYVDATAEIRVSDFDSSGYLAGEPDSFRTEIWAFDEFKVVGTEDRPVRFIGWDGTSESTDSAAWYGIFIYDSTGSASGDFNYCEISGANHGIQARNRLTVRNSTIENCDLLGISVAAADSVVIDSTTIIGPEHGINVLQGVAASVTNCTVEDCDYGAAFYSGVTFELKNSTFGGNDTGLWISKSDSSWVKGTAEDCTFENNNYGIEVTDLGDSLVTIEDCTVDDNTTTGIYCNTYGHATILSNTITDNGTGIYAYVSGAKIRSGNSITGNSTGIKCNNANAVVESTTVTSNNVGVHALNSGNPDLGHITGGNSVGYNILGGNSGYYVMNATVGVTVMAEMNYWDGKGKLGSCDPPASKIWGSVDYDSARCILPSLAPAVGSDRDRRDESKPPNVFALGQNYPNPFNPTTTIRYQVPAPGSNVSIVIYNVRGQRVRTLVDELKAPGFYETVWDGRSAHGSPVASGVYFVQMRARGFVQTKKLVTLK